MGRGFKHFVLITKHRHQVIRNASHMGIFFHALKHDLSKYSYQEFHYSKKYYAGTGSPVFYQRLSNQYFSTVCQHHTKRNKHHWEYWTDFFAGRLLAKRMPWKYAVEYVCDVLSASKTYGKKNFKPDSAINYFNDKAPHYVMNKGTEEFVRWCLTQYAESGWKNLGKKSTKAKYEELSKIYPEIDLIGTAVQQMPLPELKK